MKGFKIRVTLRDYKKQIFRVMEVREDITIDEFCTDIITVFNGLCYHLYSLKIHGTEYMCNEFENDFGEDIIFMKRSKIKKLNLVKGDKLVLNYDFGDDWEFYITVGAEVENCNFKSSRVISGKGLGIIEDCGGLWRLSDIIEGNVDKESKEWLGDTDINEFDLEEINSSLGYVETDIIK